MPKPNLRHKIKTDRRKNKSLNDILSPTAVPSNVNNVTPVPYPVHNTNLVLDVITPDGLSEKRTCLYKRLNIATLLQGVTIASTNLQDAIIELSGLGFDFTEDDIDLVNGAIVAKPDSLGYYGTSATGPTDPGEPVGITCTSYFNNSGSVGMSGLFRVAVDDQVLGDNVNLATATQLLSDVDISLNLFSLPGPPEPYRPLRAIKDTSIGTNTDQRYRIEFGFVESYPDTEFVIDWGDGVVETWSTPGERENNYWQFYDLNLVHEYLSDGVFNITITHNKPVESMSLLNITELVDFGTDIKRNLRIGSGCLREVPTTLPKYLSDLSFMFYDSWDFDSPSVLFWDTSHVLGFRATFEDCSIFNQPIGVWDVSSTVVFERMFQRAYLFNQPLNTWDVSNGRSFSYMFAGAEVFNQPLPNWNVINGITFEGMFGTAYGINCAFVQDVSMWSTPNVHDYPDRFSNDYDVRNHPHWGSERGTDLILLVSNGTLNIELTTGDVVNWGDGSPTYTHTGAFGNVSHAYTANAKVRVTTQNYAGRRRIYGTALTVVHSYPLTPFATGVYFYGSVNLKRIPVGLPSYFTTLRELVRDCTSFNPAWLNWDTRNITDTSYCFDGASSFVQDWGGPDQWDYRNVEFAERMMRNCPYQGSSYRWEVRCVPKLLTMPLEMFLNSPITARPVWGTCPA